MNIAVAMLIIESSSLLVQLTGSLPTGGLVLSAYSRLEEPSRSLLRQASQSVSGVDSARGLPTTNAVTAQQLRTNLFPKSQTTFRRSITLSISFAEITLSAPVRGIWWLPVGTRI